MAAVDDIRKRQSERAEQILKLLPEPDMIEVRLWARDQFEIGHAEGERSVDDRQIRVSSFAGCAIGVIVVGLLIQPVAIWLWPWPWAEPEIACEDYVVVEREACEARLLAGESRLDVRWWGSDKWQTADIPGFQCSRHRRTEVFMCAPAETRTAELPSTRSP